MFLSRKWMFQAVFVPAMALFATAAHAQDDCGDAPGDGDDPGAAADDGTTEGIVATIVGMNAAGLPASDQPIVAEAVAIFGNLPVSQGLVALANLSIGLVSQMQSDNLVAQQQGLPPVWGSSVIDGHAADAAAALTALGNLAAISGSTVPAEGAVDLGMDVFEGATSGAGASGLPGSILQPSVGTKIHDVQLPTPGVPTVKPFAVVLLHRGTESAWAVKNVGTAPATLYSVTADYPGWITSTTCPIGGTLAAGASCTVHVLIGGACSDFWVDVSASGPRGVTRSWTPVFSPNMSCGS